MTNHLPGCIPLPASVASASGLDLDAIRPAPLRILPLSAPVDCDVCGCPCATALLTGWAYDEPTAACYRCEARAELEYADATGSDSLALTHPALAMALEASLRPRLAALLASALEHAGMVVRERAARVVVVTSGTEVR